jgi:pyruvate carboxylase subunit B
MKYRVTIGRKKFEVRIDGDGTDVAVNGRRLRVDLRSINGGRLQSLLADNKNYEFELERLNGGFSLWHGSGQITAEVVDEKTERLRKLMGVSEAGKRQAELKASMPGLVLKVEVEPGQEVKKGDGLLIIEAMKMENEIKSTGQGIIKEVKVKSGQAIEKNQVLIVFQ